MDTQSSFQELGGQHLPASLALTLGVERDRAVCEELLPQVSRTFALSIEALPRELSDAVRVAYLLCRTVDCIEDAVNISAAERTVLFDLFDQLLASDGMNANAFVARCTAARLGETAAEATLCREAGALFRQLQRLPRVQQGAIKPWIQRMSCGMRRYCARADAAGQLRIEDLADLERYCFFVAGTVGELLTALFEPCVPSLEAPTREALRARAVPFGLGLQLVNILKDVAEDHARGVCFLPRRLLDQRGIAYPSLLEPSRRGEGLQVVRELCARARVHLGSAAEYTALWPAPEGQAMRLFCLVPLALALATLDEIEGGEATLRAGQTPKISRSAVAHVLVEAQQAAGDDRKVGTMLAHYASTKSARQSA